MSNKPESAVRGSDERELSPVRALRARLLFWRIAASVLLLAVIALGAMLYFSKNEPSPLPSPATEEPAPTEEPVRYTAWCYTPLGETLSVSGNAGEALELPGAPEIAGYRFIGWADEKGEEVPGGTVMLVGDAAFSAVYAVAFRDESAQAHHEPYFSIDGGRLFHPLGSVSRGAAAEILFSILDTELEGTGSFADVDPSSSCYRATAVFKDLGVIGGSRFHPDDPISCAEFFEMLAHFFPKSIGSFEFSQIPANDARHAAFSLAMDMGWIDDLDISPDRNLTRAEAACIFNSLCGRSAHAEGDFAKVGTILDVSFDDPCFWDIAEACIAHDASQTADGEVWTASDALSLYGEGLFFIGTELHCIDERGGAVVNGSYGNFDFGPDGVITTGMPELDALVQQTLRERVNPATMDPERMLYILYNFVTYSNDYLRVHYYDVGDTSWVNDEAYHMFTVKKGNCYCYSSQFYVLAKAIGFDAVIYSGTIEPNDSPHAWVEIEVDGQWYIYDTNLEYTQVHFNNFHGSFYKEPYWKAKGWHYFRGDEIEAEIADRS